MSCGVCRQLGYISLCTVAANIYIYICCCQLARGDKERSFIIATRGSPHALLGGLVPVQCVSTCALRCGNVAHYTAQTGSPLLRLIYLPVLDIKYIVILFYCKYFVSRKWNRFCCALQKTCISQLSTTATAAVAPSGL